MWQVSILYTGTPFHTHHKAHVACCEPFRLCWVLYLVPDEGGKPRSKSRNFRASRHQLIHRTHSTGHTEVWGSPSWKWTYWGWGWDHWARPAIPAFWWRRWGGWKRHNRDETGVQKIVVENSCFAPIVKMLKACNKSENFCKEHWTTPWCRLFYPHFLV